MSIEPHHACVSIALISREGGGAGPVDSSPEIVSPTFIQDVGCFPTPYLPTESSPKSSSMYAQALPIAYYRPMILEQALGEFLGDGNYRVVQVKICPGSGHLVLACGLTDREYFAGHWHVEVAWMLSLVSEDNLAAVVQKRAKSAKMLTSYIN